MADRILTEAGDFLVTEANDNLVTEDAVAAVVAFSGAGSSLRRSNKSNKSNNSNIGPRTRTKRTDRGLFSDESDAEADRQRAAAEAAQQAMANAALSKAVAANLAALKAKAIEAEQNDEEAAIFLLLLAA